MIARLSKKPPKKSKISAPKAARPKTAANARSPTAIKEESPESSSETSSSDDDSEYESSDDELEITEPSPLPASRPQEPLQAVRYDVIKALWLPHKKAAEAEQIRNALKDFWEVVRTIRDRWKSDTADLKQAEEGKKESEVPRLKSRVKAQRDMIQMALKTAIEHGHPDIIRLYVLANFPLLFTIPTHPLPTSPTPRLLYIWSKLPHYATWVPEGCSFGRKLARRRIDMQAAGNSSAFWMDAGHHHTRLSVEDPQLQERRTSQNNSQTSRMHKIHCVKNSRAFAAATQAPRAAANVAFRAQRGVSETL